MQPEYYASLFRRYNTYVRDYDLNNKIYRVACGPNVDDYEWTDKVMQNAWRKADGLSLHYYTIPTGNWNNKGSATYFTQNDYNATVIKAYKMDELITRHTEIMNRHDPAHKVDLIVDEWGTWYDVEPGTNPGFLYQQNTMRDAIVAALTLNIFNKHSDRVKMANIAQTANVLQSVVLTDGEDMLLTPTYYVFKMFKQHQNSTLLGSYITTPVMESEAGKAPQLVESASVDENGVICATVANISSDETAEFKCQIADSKIKSVKAEIICGDMKAYNDFTHKETVKTEVFGDFEQTEDGFIAKLPPCSVAKFTVENERM